MTAVTRLQGLAVLTGLLLWGPGCGKPAAVVDGGTPGTNECTRDQDCPDPDLFQCSNFECVPSCRRKDDCSNAVRGTHQLSQCQGSLGCECEDFKCVGALCSEDSQCDPSTVCRNGQCVSPPAASSAARCQIAPDFVIGKTGTQVKLAVSASTPTGPLVLKDGITWTALAGATLNGSGSGTTATFTLGASTTGAAEIVEAKIGGISCKSKARILPALTSGWRAVVTDELSGRAITGGKLVVSDPATGDTVSTVDITDGVATFTSTASPVTVTAFHADYGYLTIANYVPSGPDARDLSFVLRRNQNDTYGGYKGTFTGVPQSPNVHAAIAGMSLPGSVTDLSLEQLLGATVPTDVKIGTVVDMKAVPLPAGVFLGFTDTQIKTQVAGQGLAGVCTTGDNVETRISNGLCGTRTAWGLSGDVPISELPLDAFTTGGGIAGIDFSKVLTRVLPIFKRFSSSVVRDVEFSLKPSSLKPTDGGYDTSDFTPADHAFQGVPLGFAFVVKSPDLPSYKNAPLDGVVLLGGATVAGRGVVPLGLGVGVNTNPVDGKVDSQSGLPVGSLLLRMAPTHHGLEGSPYGIISIATSIKAATDANAGLAASAIFERLPTNKLIFDPTGATGSVQLTGTYLPIPEGARYNFTDSPLPALLKRTFKLDAAAAVAGSSIVRVLFSDSAQHRWTVVFAPSDAESGFALPKPPSGLADRTYALNNPNLERSSMVVQTLKLNSAPGAGGSAISFNGLVELNSTNADRLVDYTAAFTLLDYGSPGVSFLTPAKAGDTVPKNTDVKVKVSHFKLGTTAAEDGVVRLEIVGGTAQCQPATPLVASTEVVQGKGEVLIRLPSDCTGNGVTLRARLYNITNTQPIAPIVATEILANIQ